MPGLVIDEPVVDLVGYYGVQFVLNFQVFNADGTARNLTGFSARMQTRATERDETPVHDLSSTGDDPEIAITAATGVIVVTIPSADMIVNAKRLFFDIVLVSSLDEVERLFGGFFTIRKTITEVA